MHNKDEHSHLTTDSYSRTRYRFCRDDIAKKYPSSYREDNVRDRREKAALMFLFRFLPKGGNILDLPCGSGRISRLLLQQGFKVTAADISTGMLDHLTADMGKEHLKNKQLNVQESDVMNSGFAPGSFDGVICNRLFHHFSESQTRAQALTELARISKGPIIISFFNSFSLSAGFRTLRHKIKRHKLKDRIPITLSTFKQDIANSGLHIVARRAVKWGISPHWYLVLEPDTLATLIEPLSKII